MAAVIEADKSTSIAHGGWRYWLERVCTRQLAKGEEYKLLHFLLDGGHDLREDEIFAPPEVGERRVSATLTPVEGLLLFIRLALVRLRSQVARARTDGHFAARRSRLYFCHGNLVRLLARARSSKAPRPFSAIERLLLYAQASNLSHTLAQLHPDRRVSRAAARVSRRQLDRIEAEATRWRHASREIQTIRAMATYRRALHASFENPDLAPRYLTMLLDYGRADIPRGLYFHAAREILGLPLRHRRTVLGDARLAVGTAFGLLPPQRVLDRVGLSYLLAADAAFCGAPDLAMAMRTVARTLIASAAHIFEHAHLSRDLERIDRQLLSQMSRCAPCETDVSNDIERLTSRFGSQVETDLRGAYGELTQPPRLARLSTTLYYSAARAWLTRLLDDTDSLAAQEAVLKAANSALMTLRHQPAALRLVRIGCLCRLLRAQGRELIDESFADFERLICVTVLAGDWQALIDQLLSGRHRFLEKLGFDGESKRLIKLGEYFEALFSITRTPDDVRNGPTLIDRVLFGDRVPARTLGHQISAIIDRWRADSRLEQTDISVAEWVQSYALAHRRQEFTADSADPHVCRFFDDCRRIIELAEEVSVAHNVDVVTAWTSMAWAALFLARVARGVGGGQRGAFRTPAGSDLDLVARGVEWVDRALALPATQERSASRFRALDVRTRLEDMRGSEADRAVIESIAESMLAIDEQRLDTTRVGSRRQRAVIRTERGLTTVIGRRWCESFHGGVALNDHPVLLERLRLLQRLKTFNYGPVVELPEREAAADVSESVADQAVDYFARTETAEPHLPARIDALTPADQEKLRAHLHEHQVAILDFVTNPGAGGGHWRNAVNKGRGTICFVITATSTQLHVRPIYLDVPEALIREATDGAPDESGYNAGLATSVVYPDAGNTADGKPPEALSELSKRLFPSVLRSALAGQRGVYLCPHRRLFQVPLHAFPLDEPLFTRFQVSYAVKTQHVIEMLKADAGTRPEKPLWTLLNTRELGDAARMLPGELRSRNAWSRPLSVDQAMRDAADAQLAVVCCHGELDHARPTRARLCLWGGGRITADDLYGLATPAAPGAHPVLDFSRTVWVIAACDAGNTRIGLQTAPGFGLTLVHCGAAGVTTCIYRVQPHVAARFLSLYMQFCNEYPAPFTKVVRSMFANDPHRGFSRHTRWAWAASFVSYGLLAPTSLVQSC